MTVYHHYNLVALLANCIPRYIPADIHVSAQLQSCMCLVIQKQVQLVGRSSMVPGHEEEVVMVLASEEARD